MFVCGEIKTVNEYPRTDDDFEAMANEALQRFIQNYKNTTYVKIKDKLCQNYKIC